MFPTYNALQGGGSIQVGTGLAPQPAQTYQPQPAQNFVQTPQSSPGVTLGYSTTAAPQVYYDSYGNAYGSQAAANAVNQNVAGFDQGIGNVNAGLGRLPGQLDVGNRNIDTGYNSGLNQLNQSKTTAQGAYDTTKTQQRQDYVGTKNTIGANAGNSLNGLLRLLGSRGAGGGSVAQFNAPQAIGREASIQRSGAGQTFGRNEQTLDTNWNNFNTGWDNSLQDLGRQRDNSRNSLQSQIESTRGGLLQQLAQLQGQRASAIGGNPAAAAQPYLDSANQALSQSDQLGLQSPVFQVQPTVYNAPNLDAYTANPFATPQSSKSSLSDSVTPYFTSLLLGGQKDKQPNLQGAF